MGEAGDAAAAGELDEITERIVGMLGRKERSWADIYRLVAEVRARGLWRESFRSFTRWVEDLAIRSHCNVQYIWRISRAGRFYEAFRGREEAAGREVPELERSGLGDEMISDIDRIGEHNDARADAYMRAALAGDLSRAEVRQIVKATAGARAARRAARRAAGGPGPAPGPTAEDLLTSLRPESLYSAELLGRDGLRGERRVWRVLAEFPVRTSSGGRAARMDALCIGPRPQGEGLPGAWDQYDVTLDMVEIKVSERDLLRDEKKSEYAHFCDRCWLAVPSSLEPAAVGAAPAGWGVLSWDPATRAFSRALEATPTVAPALRAEALATALVKVLPAL